MANLVLLLKLLLNHLQFFIQVFKGDFKDSTSHVVVSVRLCSATIIVTLLQLFDLLFCTLKT